jgi:hypothetical protein
MDQFELDERAAQQQAEQEAIARIRREHGGSSFMKVPDHLQQPYET